MKTKPALLAVMIMTCIISTSAFGLNLQFLNYSPVRYFTDKDWELYRSAGADILNNQPDGEIVKWENPDSGASGEIKALNTFESNGMKCRQIQVFNSAGGLTGGGKFYFCQEPDGEWKAATPKQ